MIAGPPMSTAATHTRSASSSPRAPRAPYALEPATFPLPVLAASIGRAPLGGPREVALACFIVGRLVRDTVDSGDILSTEQRRARAQGAKHWLGSAALPGAVRTALVRLADTTGGLDSDAVRAALESVMTVT